ncbi:lipopolysaccharide biosynthesis protein [Pseudonocardia acidicola]|uniref:Oligosaccharide flippase family protein n=1 Tax=Pseudonocardia acidicola TaxID=2724939 RepID=A0ABX1S9Z9_9PSEU|nr:oligosaccharide flippase family protein [Pseudonocardia acidicola]NMH98390.1 oligosaccharide flippase family protein [Pseudonocardia acidicola]
MSVPLYRNAYALMLNTLVNSVFGLLYWIVAARTFSAEEVGRGNALVSMMLLVSTLTQLNFGQALIRFLPRAGTASRRLVGSAYGVCTGLAMIGAGGVAAFCHFAMKPTDALYMSLPFALWFVLSTVIWSVFNIQDSTLTGLRAAIWVPLENGLYGLLKLGLLIVVTRTSIADGVFTSWTLPVFALLVPVNLLIFRRILPRHADETKADQKPPSRQGLARYMAGDYAGQVFNQLGSTFLPVLVVAQLGTAQGAYFLPAQTAVVAMNLLSLAITSSLVVEAVTIESQARRYAVAVVRRIGVTVLPAASLIALAAPWLLELFGSEYRANATSLLQLLMLSTFPRVIVSLYMTMARLQSRTAPLAILQLVQSASVIGGTVLLSSSLGLNAVGWSVLITEIVLAVVVTPRVIRWLAPGFGRRFRPRKDVLRESA